jgi:hypothetical protein
VIQIPTEKPYNNIFSLSDESVKWIKENNPPKKIDVDFVVICDCHYDEETNTAKHALVATIK